MSNTETLALISYIIGFVIFMFLSYKDLKHADNYILPAERNRCREKPYKEPWAITGITNKQKHTSKAAVNGAPRVNPWFPLHDPSSPSASASAKLRRDKTPLSYAWPERRHHAEANEDSIPTRINAGSPAKADENTEAH